MSEWKTLAELNNPIGVTAVQLVKDDAAGWTEIHARIGDLRGMCTDGDAHTDIDRALATLDDVLYRALVLGDKSTAKSDAADSKGVDG